MPTAADIRNERIDNLVNWAEGRSNVDLDKLLNQARSVWPRVRNPTLHSYAESALRIITAKKKSKEGP